LCNGFLIKKLLIWLRELSNLGEEPILLKD
jgi:hypothetical protein